MYTGCNLKTTDFHECALIGVCAFIRSNTVWYGAGGVSRYMFSYCIRSNYRTYPYKRTVKKFRSLQITARIIFLYVILKAYVVGTHLNCIDLSMQFRWVPQHMPL